MDWSASVGPWLPKSSSDEGFDMWVLVCWERMIPGIVEGLKHPGGSDRHPPPSRHVYPLSSLSHCHIAPTSAPGPWCNMALAIISRYQAHNLICKPTKLWNYSWTLGGVLEILRTDIEGRGQPPGVSDKKSASTEHAQATPLTSTSWALLIFVKNDW